MTNRRGTFRERKERKTSEGNIIERGKEKEGRRTKNIRGCRSSVSKEEIHLNILRRIIFNFFSTSKCTAQFHKLRKRGKNFFYYRSFISCG